MGSHLNRNRNWTTDKTQGNRLRWLSKVIQNNKGYSQFVHFSTF